MRPSYIAACLGLEFARFYRNTPVAEYSLKCFDIRASSTCPRTDETAVVRLTQREQFGGT